MRSFYSGDAAWLPWFPHSHTFSGLNERKNVDCSNPYEEALILGMSNVVSRVQVSAMLSRRKPPGQGDRLDCVFTCNPITPHLTATDHGMEMDELSKFYCH